MEKASERAREREREKRNIMSKSNTEKLIQRFRCNAYVESAHNKIHNDVLLLLLLFFFK